jgi:hypothetical protein
MLNYKSVIQCLTTYLIGEITRAIPHTRVV